MSLEDVLYLRTWDYSEKKPIMACLGIPLGVLFLSLSRFIASAPPKDACDLRAVVGQALSLPFEHKQLGNNDTLRWTHNSSIIFYQQSSRVLIGKPKDISASGALRLQNLQLSGTGLYKADLLDQDGKHVTGWTGRLCVAGKLPKPQVTFVCENIVILHCDAPKPQGAVFAWTLNDKALKGETQATLRISSAKLKGENNFTCGAVNQPGAETSDAIRLHCRHSGVAPPALYCFQAKTVMAAMAGGGCLILLLLVTVTISCLHCGRRRAQASPAPQGELPMVPTAQHQRTDSFIPDYETMRSSEGYLAPGTQPPPGVVIQEVDPSEAQERPSHATGADREQPSPVPKPRTKMPQNHGN